MTKSLKYFIAAPTRIAKGIPSDIKTLTVSRSWIFLEISKAIKHHSVIAKIILSLLIGLKLGGVLGAILAIPIATGINIAIEDIMATKEKPTFNI